MKINAYSSFIVAQCIRWNYCPSNPSCLRVAVVVVVVAVVVLVVVVVVIAVVVIVDRGEIVGNDGSPVETGVR